MRRTFHREVFLQGPAGRLEASLWVSEMKEGSGPVRLAGLVCHPHPLYGGTMHNKVVFQVARTLQALRLPVLRFNFRGAGLSQGEHDGGRGELDDVRAALDYLSEQFQESRIVLAGFSFGAWVGLRAGCEDSRVVDLIGLGLPVENSDFSYLKRCTKAKLFVQGTADPYGARRTVEALYAQVPEPRALVFVDGANHFFTGQLDAVGEAIRQWLEQRHPELHTPA
ncbi:MAG: alpha/beta hydrolase [Firmicutes bacterium]|nr:alpha/beta hydrolase [Bacillota bacterium]